jgi:DNA-directed RNA polymerase subunit RPC12/RpoP
MNSDKHTRLVSCPECEHDIFLETPIEVGDPITCPNCWAGLIVYSLEPPELDWEFEADDDDDNWELE